MHFYCVCYLLLCVHQLPVNIYPRNKRKMVCLQEGASGISPQTHTSGSLNTLIWKANISSWKKKTTPCHYIWHIINHWTLDVLHSNSNFHTSMHLTEHLSLITSIMVAVGGNQQINVTWKGFAINPCSPPSFYCTTLNHAPPVSLHSVRTEFLSTLPQLSFLLTFLPFLLPPGWFLPICCCSFFIALKRHKGRGLIAE